MSCPDCSNDVEAVRNRGEKVRALQLQNRELQNAVDRANAAMLKHQKHNGALEMAIQEAHRDLDAAIQQRDKAYEEKDAADRLIDEMRPVVEAAMTVYEVQERAMTRGKDIGAVKAYEETREAHLAACEAMNRAVAAFNVKAIEKRDQDCGCPHPGEHAKGCFRLKRFDPCCYLWVAHGTGHSQDCVEKRNYVPPPLDCGCEHPGEECDCACHTKKD